MTRVLVTGASGFLGRRLFARLSQHADVVGTYCKRPVDGLPLCALDATDAEQVDALIGAGAFDVCVHAAGTCDLEFCELNPEQALRVNAGATRNVAAACRRARTRLLYISTDHVFDGQPAFAYDEDDRPRPLQVYGLSKLAGEEAVLAAAGALSLRVPIVYGQSAEDERDTFVVRVLRELALGHELAADNQATSYPVRVDELADAVARLLACGARGIVHYGSAQGVTDYRWARLIAETFGFDAHAIVARPQRGLAVRPINNQLHSRRLRDLGIAPPSPISDGIQSLRASWQTN